MRITKNVDFLKPLVTKLDLYEKAEKAIAALKVRVEPKIEPKAEITAPPIVTESQGRLLLRGYKKNINVSELEVTRKPLDIDNPVKLLLILQPEPLPHAWQFEELMRMAGYLTKGKYAPEDKTLITHENPYKLILPAANGSGKDMFMIAAFAIWFVLKRARNKVIITSASFEQLKYQTETHIRNLANKANKVFGKLFTNTQFHHIVPELCSEIKLFATDDPGKAEAYHPDYGGEMALIINEAKSVQASIFEALNRCTGYSHWLEVSSPGGRSGHMYNEVADAIAYPAPAELGKFYYRKITAYDCPHISQAHIEDRRKKAGADSAWFRSSILAEFADIDTSSVIPETVLEMCLKEKILPYGDDIGIGLDLAAGGDETACFVRKGNCIIHSFFFRQENTDLGADYINSQLSTWKDSAYTFNADNGGIGLGYIDGLVKRGWQVQRRNNQSPARNKREFLNLGAEMWFKLKRLLERKEIIFPANIAKLQTQLTTRLFKGLESTQGKYALEAKPQARASGRPSPDRADAFVLCFYSYQPSTNQEAVEDTRNLVAIEQLNRVSFDWSFKKEQTNGRFTNLSGKI